MPLNEAQGLYPSSLTKTQKDEAVRAIYGLGETMSPGELTYEERIKMRRMLDALDAKEAGGMKDFDLNKPPQVAYVFREYPFLMYHPDGTTRSARNRQEREQLLSKGWREDPGAEPEPEPVEQAPATQAKKRPGK